MKFEATIDPDDPRLSAFLLGELSPEEMLVVEAQLRRSPDAQAELDLMRSAVEMLRESFAAEWIEGMDEAPALTILPAPEVGNVIDFQGGGEVVTPKVKRFPTRVASIAALAAALVTAAFVLPDFSTDQAGPELAEVSPVTSASISEFAVAEADVPSVAAPVAAEPTAAPAVPEAPKNAPVSVPKFGHQGGGEAADGIQLASMVPSFTGDTGMADFRPLGSDPTITEVRFLSDDPIDLRSTPLPAALLSYLPEEAAAARATKAKMNNASHASRARQLGLSNVYLDTERYPDPEIVHREIELTGGVFRSDSEQTRSLYRAEQRSHASGRTSVIVEGMIRLEAGTHVGVLANEPDPSFDFGIVPVSYSSASQPEILNLPSGATLRKVETPSVGSPNVATGDIATRYVIRQQDRVRRAAALAEAGRRQLETGEYGSAASNFALSLEILPDAPATEKLRSQIMSRLEKANAAMAE